MTSRIHQAMRFIEAFMAIIVGRRVPVRWGNAATGATRDSDGSVALPRPKTGDAAEIALLTRLAVHEGGHLTKTERGWSERLPAAARALFNALEDPRMEREQTKEYPGASIILRRGLGEALTDISQQDSEQLGGDLQRALSLELVLRGFLHLQPYPEVQQLVPVILQRMDGILSAEQRKLLDGAVQKLATASSSLDAEAIATRLDSDLRALQQHHQEPPQPQQQQPQQEDAEQAEEGQPQAAADQSSAPETDEPDQAPDTAGGQDRPEASASEADDAGPDASPERGECQPGDGGEDSDHQQDGHGRPVQDQADDKNASDDAQGASEAVAGGDQAGDDSDGEAGDDAGAGNGDTTRGDPTGSSDRSSQGDQVGQDGQDGPAEASAQPDTGAAGQGASGGEPLDAPGEQSMAAGTMASDQDGNASPAQGEAAHGDGDGDLDLGGLLRRVLVSRYGSDGEAGDSEQDKAEQQSPQVTDDDINAVAQALAAPEGTDDFDELLQRSLSAIKAGGDSEKGANAQDAGAGDQLAGASSGGVREMDRRGDLCGVQSRMVVVLQRELQDRKRKPVRAAPAGARVLTHRYWRLHTMGDTNVFTTKRHVAGIDAAVSILIDRSGSMGAGLGVALDAGLAFSLALQRLHISTRVAAFPGVNTVTEEVQRFGEPARLCEERAKALTADGGTPLGAAMLAALAELAQRSEQRKFLVVVTDGQPFDSDVVAQALRLCEHVYVQVLGVGIMVDIRGCIPSSVQISDVHELPGALSELFRSGMAEKLAA